MDVAAIRREFLHAKSTPSDMYQHMDTLYDLATKCDHIVEGGVRYVVSTWAFLYGCACRGGTVHGYCWNRLPEITRAEDICRNAGVYWFYHDGDWLKQEIPKTDLLMIDTNHFYSQLRQELDTHGPKARRFIVLHDTTTFGDIGADNKAPGLWAAVEEFIAIHPWRILKRYTHCNGLTILERTHES